MALSDQDIQRISDAIGDQQRRDQVYGDPMDPGKPFRGLDTYTRIPADVGSRYQAHGITSGTAADQIKALQKLLTEGIDKNRPFHTGQLSYADDGDRYTAQAAGIGFKDAKHFAVVGGPDQQLKDDGIKYVLMDEYMSKYKEELEKEFPQVEFLKHGEEEEFLRFDAELEDSKKLKDVERATAGEQRPDQTLADVEQKTAASEAQGLASGGLLNAINTLNQRLESLEKIIGALDSRQAEMSQAYANAGGSQYQYEGVAGELGGGISGITQRDALEAAKQNVPDWDQLSQKDQKAHTIAELHQLKAETYGQTPTQAKMRALERSGADPEAIRLGKEGAERLERFKASDERDDAEEAQRRDFWGLLGDVTSMGRTMHEIGGGGRGGRMQKRQEAIDKSNSLLSRPPPLPNFGRRGGAAATSDDADLSDATRGNSAVDAMAGGMGGGLSGAEADGGLGTANKDIQELITVMRELIAELKAKNTAGETQEPGIQEDGSFVPGGAGEMAATPPPARGMPPASSGAMPPWLPTVLRTM